MDTVRLGVQNAQIWAACVVICRESTTTLKADISLAVTLIVSREP
jgi:hypothetical protein